MTTPALRAENLGVHLGGRAVLEGLNLEIPAGRFVGLFGANGAGKTTFFRVALGLLPPSAGWIRLLGLPPRRGRIQVGYVPQLAPAALAGTLSGRAFVAAARQGHRWGFALGRREAVTAIDEAIERVGATAFADRALERLSGGQRHRFLLAQALVNRPRLLLLDEPLANLDPAAQVDFIELVRGLCRQEGLTVLFSAHDINSLTAAMDRVLFMAAGRACLGTIDAVLQDDRLSGLYGFPMHVVRNSGRIFVFPARGFMPERDTHHRHPCA